MLNLMLFYPLCRLLLFFVANGNVQNCFSLIIWMSVFIVVDILVMTFFICKELFIVQLEWNDINVSFIFCAGFGAF